MLLLSMTPSEMRQSIRADYPTIVPTIAEVSKRWRKQVLRSNRTRRMVRTDSVTCIKSKQEYLFVHVWDPDIRRLDYLVLFAVVHDFAHTYYIADTLNDSSSDRDILTVYTDHFFRRFAERTGMSKDTTIEQAIAAYYRGYTQNVLLYWDDTDDHNCHRAVYAEQQGIKLSDVEENKWILYRTFVSLDMLKSSQREAYRNVMEIIERCNNMRIKCDRNYDSFVDYIKENSDDLAIINEARDIYAKYFET